MCGIGAPRRCTAAELRLNAAVAPRWRFHVPKHRPRAAAAAAAATTATHAAAAMHARAHEAPPQLTAARCLAMPAGHTVKNTGAKQSQAAAALVSDRRWCCSGTPLSADVGDLYGQLVALQLSPLNNKVRCCVNAGRLQRATAGRLQHAACAHACMRTCVTRARIRAPPATDPASNAARCGLPPATSACNGCRPFSTTE